MERWWRFDRSDYAVLRGVLVMAVLVGAVGPAFDVVAWLRRQPMIWQSGTRGEAPAATEAVSGATGRYGGMVNWRFPAPSALQRLGAMLPELWALLVLVLAAASLWRIVGSLERQAAFTQATLRAVRVLGLALLAYVVLGWFVALVADQLVMMPARQGALLWTTELHASDFALGLVAMLTIALAELFRQGARMAQDVEGLV